MKTDKLLLATCVACAGILAYGNAIAEVTIIDDYLGLEGVTKIYTDPDPYVPDYGNDEIYVPVYNDNETTCFKDYLGLEGVTKCY